jgi:hypothetical protein
MSDLSALAYRVEGLDGVDHEVDRLIADAIGWQQIITNERGEQAFRFLRRYTGSLDAAMTLVPGGFQFEVTTTGYKPGATVCGDSLTGVHEGSYAATPALALTAAALRAREDIAKIGGEQ